MTREEAMNVLKKYTDTDSGISRVVAEAHSKAIKALKQEPCEDCISRADTISVVSKALSRTFVEHENVANNIINELPSVTPQEPEIIRCKDCREFRRYINTDITFCDRTEVEVKGDDFCSHAKKMEG